MGDKIKFGFSKVIKKPNLLIQNGAKPQEKSKIELISEIEGTSIKVEGKNPDDETESKLIIPMTNDQKTTPLAKLLAQKKLKNLVSIKREAENGYEDPSNEVAPMEVDIKKEPIDETLEQQAARELIEDLQSKAVKSETKIFEVPINPDELPLEGAKESSMDDYERVPIGDFGKAMLRGMGWKEEEKKEDDKKPWMDAPIQRPKGMGLGADKVIKKQALLIAPNQSETLEVKKNACIKVLAGKHKNLYGTIEGFDDGGGRVIVKLAIGAMKVTMNEFMVQAVGRQEFATYGKILNSKKYEEFKANKDGTKFTTTSSQIRPRDEPETSNPRRDRSPERSKKSSRTPERRKTSRSPDRRRNSRSPDRRRKSRTPERTRRSSRDRSRSRNGHKSHRDRYENSSDVRKYRGRSRSRDKHSKRSSSDERSHKKKSSKHKKHYSSSPDSKYSSGDERKHKKKTKKSKHRKRDRS